MDSTACTMVLVDQEMCDMGPNPLGAATREEWMPTTHQAGHHWWRGSNGEGSGPNGEGSDGRDYSRRNRGCAEIMLADLPPNFMDNQMLVKLSVMFHRRWERGMGDTNGAITDNGLPKPAKSEPNNCRAAILYIVTSISHCDN